MTGIEVIVVFNTVAMVANTIVIFFNNKVIGKVMEDVKPD
jgi:hypothetical protein